MKRQITWTYPLSWLSLNQLTRLRMGDFLSCSANVTAAAVAALVVAAVLTAVGIALQRQVR